MTGNGKPERPESQNDRKARTKGIDRTIGIEGTIGLAGTIGKIGAMNPAPLGDGDRLRCVKS